MQGPGGEDPDGNFREGTRAMAVGTRDGRKEGWRGGGRKMREWGRGWAALSGWPLNEGPMGPQPSLRALTSTQKWQMRAVSCRACPAFNQEWQPPQGPGQGPSCPRS